MRPVFGLKDIPVIAYAGFVVILIPTRSLDLALYGYPDLHILFLLPD
jgi:hypothetical protein